jgi:hypothetical protein
MGYIVLLPKVISKNSDPAEQFPAAKTRENASGGIRELVQGLFR